MPRSLPSHPGAPPTDGRVRRRRRSLFAALVTALSGVLLAVGPGAPAWGAVVVADPGRPGAWQATGDLGLDLAARVNVTQGVVGYCVGDSDRGPGTVAAASGGRYTYPAHRTVDAGTAYVPNPETVRGSLEDLTVPADRTGALAYVLATQQDAAVRDPREAMATHHALRSLSTGGPSTRQSAVSADVRTRAADLLEAASRRAGPYTVEPRTEVTDGGRRGEAHEVGVRSAAGAWLAGFSFTATLDGAATFDDGANSLAGTTAEAPLTLPLRATGTGPVRVHLQVRGLPATSFDVLESGPESGRAQDLFVAGPAVEVTGSSEPARLVMLAVSTRARHTGDGEHPVLGDGLVDDVTVTGDVPDGATTRVDLFAWAQDGPPVCEAPLWSSTLPLTGPGDYTTSPFVPTHAGPHGFVERTFAADGALLSEGECGDADETLLVGPAPPTAQPEPTGLMPAEPEPVEVVPSEPMPLEAAPVGGEPVGPAPAEPALVANEAAPPGSDAAMLADTGIDPRLPLVGAGLVVLVGVVLAAVSRRLRVEASRPTPRRAVVRVHVTPTEIGAAHG